MNATRKGKAVLIRRSVQTLSLAFFLWLLQRTASPLADTLLPVDSFLRMDPLVALAVPVAARQWLSTLFPGLIVISLALLAGRLFCGYICPMGTTLDLAGTVTRKLGGSRQKVRKSNAADGDSLSGLRYGKYLLLAGILGSALAGVNAVFWASPIPLITRFYALLLHPVLVLVSSEGLSLGQSLFEGSELFGLEYLQIAGRRYFSLYFLVAFFGTLFTLERIRPRFWCRYLCPAGALLALFSLRPLWKKQVRGCNACGQCARACPTSAIAGGAESVTAHTECITCRTCVAVCPKQGVAFRIGHSRAAIASRKKEAAAGAAGPGLPSRRAFLTAAGGGAFMAAVSLSGTGTLLSGNAKGVIWPSECIRPPGALPEPAFLDRCVRCGQCMKVCPSNGLQPTWFAAGPEGVFSPVLVSRRGACEPECNACGHVCPTGAIQPLPMEEKYWAKIGTAVVQPGLCLAWAEGRRCVVCEEVCPYGAIESVQTPGAGVAVPVVRASHCYGCGYCEQFCPVRVPAIVVEPLNALRLSHSGYRSTGEAAGLSLRPTSQRSGEEQQPVTDLPDGALPPGFLE